VPGIGEPKPELAGHGRPECRLDAAQFGKKAQREPCRSFEGPSAALELVVDEMHRPPIEHQLAVDEGTTFVLLLTEDDALTLEIPAKVHECQLT
jgi:hypothetical protein